jgi:hypothetical protein
MRVLILVIYLIAVQLVTATLRAQQPTPKLELGAQFSSIDFNGFLEKPAGIGARFHYNLGAHFATDSEVIHYPENPSGDYGETTALFGVRVGERWERFGAFGRARGGFVHFGGANHNLLLPRKTVGSLDFGGTIEYYASRRLLLRLEAGDLIVPYGDGMAILSTGTIKKLGTRHNLTTSLGFAVRF